MTALLLTRSPEKATAAILTVRHESYLEDVTVHLTMQELIDLEGACAAVRLQLEVGDAPKEAKKEPEKYGRKSGLELWCEAAGIDLDLLAADLEGDAKLAKTMKDTSDVAKLARPVFVGGTPRSAKEFFARMGINFNGEVGALILDEAPVKSVNGHRGHVAIEGSQYELRTTAQPNSLPLPVHPSEIGTLVDKIAGNAHRSPAKVARRVLDECVEMCLEAGTTPHEILVGVTDSLHNQAIKLSADSAVTLFPSQLQRCGTKVALTKEIADVHLVLADLLYVSEISVSDVSTEQRTKFSRLSSPEAKFATDGHTFYLKKSHIKDGTPST